jgi:hypothetical protein
MSIKSILYLIPILLLSLSCKSQEAGSSFLWNEAPLRVESDPPGASIFIVGKEVGITPALLTKNQIYPAGYDPQYKDLYAHIVLKKEGCDTFTKRIMVPEDFKRGISVKLNCHVITMRWDPSATQRANDQIGRNRYLHLQ